MNLSFDKKQDVMSSVTQPNSTTVINPSAHQKIALEATLIVLRTQEAHEKLRRMFSV